MDESLEQLYFNWLYAKIHLTDIPYDVYSSLLHILHKTEFIWLLTGDDNRAEDGIDLRKEFIRESRLEVDETWFDDGCSVLEMMVAFSRRAQFDTEISSSQWFWQFISNLGLSDCHNDSVDAEFVAEILYIFVWRTYDYDGTGGMFPLKDPSNDQRKVEIWYQFCEYLVDNDIE